MSSYSTRQVGAANTLDYKVYIEKDGKPVSPFHDIPLYANEEKTILNMIVEVQDGPMLNWKFPKNKN